MASTSDIGDNAGEEGWQIRKRRHLTNAFNGGREATNNPISKRDKL